MREGDAKLKYTHSHNEGDRNIGEQGREELGWKLRTWQRPWLETLLAPLTLK